MEPKSEQNPFQKPQKPITVYWVNGKHQSDANLDPETHAWMIKFLENLLAQEDIWPFASESTVHDELSELEALDAKVQGEECPQALEWILQAHRKHGG